MRESTGIDGTAEQQQARMRASSSWAAQHQQSSSRHETHSHTGPMTPIMPRLLFLLYIWLPSTLPATPPPQSIWPYPTGAISTSTTIATISTNLRIRCLRDTTYLPPLRDLALVRSTYSWRKPLQLLLYYQYSSSVRRPGGCGVAGHSRTQHGTKPTK